MFILQFSVLFTYDYHHDFHISENTELSESIEREVKV